MHYTHMHIHVDTYTHKHVYAHRHTQALHIHTYTSTCTHTNTYTHTHVHTYTYIHIHTCIHADAHIHIYTPQMLLVWSMMSNSHRNILGLTLAEESTCFVGSTQEGLAGCLVSVSHITGNCQTVLQPGSWLSSPLCFKLGNEIHQGPCCPSSS